MKVVQIIIFYLVHAMENHYPIIIHSWNCYNAQSVFKFGTFLSFSDQQLCKDVTDLKNIAAKLANQKGQ